MANEDDLISSSEAGAILGRTVRTVHRLADAGELEPVRKLPGRTGAYLFRRADVMAWLARHQQQPTEP